MVIEKVYQDKSNITYKSVNCPNEDMLSGMLPVSWLPERDLYIHKYHNRLKVWMYVEKITYKVVKKLSKDKDY